MDLELKDFEDKINNITEQFMSLLDSNDIIENSVENKFENTSKSFIGDYSKEPTIYNRQPTNFGNTSAFKLGTEGIQFGGIAYGTSNSQEELPKHALKFDSVEQMELNRELEKLYQEKKNDISNEYFTESTIAFSDSNIGGINHFGSSIGEEYTKIQTNSTLNNKEVYDMSNYNGEKENVFYSFATIPTERALVEKKDWKDVLFMDIPWDTKIDIWGGIKKFCNVQVKFTF